MSVATDHLVVVPAAALIDLLDVAELAADKRAEALHHEDALVVGVRGACREVRARADLPRVEWRDVRTDVVPAG